MRENNDRIDLIWEQIYIFLKLSFQTNKIDTKSKIFLFLEPNIQNLVKKLNELVQKKKKKKIFLSSYSKFCLTELCIGNLHKGELFQSFDECFDESIAFIEDCSIYLLSEFNV